MQWSGQNRTRANRARCLFAPKLRWFPSSHLNGVFPLKGGEDARKSGHQTRIGFDSHQCCSTFLAQIGWRPQRRPTREKVHTLKNNEVPIQLLCARFSSGSPIDLSAGGSRQRGFNLLTDVLYDIFMDDSFAKIPYGLHKEKHILN